MFFHLHLHLRIIVASCIIRASGIDWVNKVNFDFCRNNRKTFSAYVWQ